MRSMFKTLLAATAMTGVATFVSAPASADGFGLSFGPGGGVSFSVSTGGYCDTWGCPDDYWGYPVYYGPVFWGGRWYDGPLYYRYSGGTYWYWVHGGWRRDEWRGSRPSWWRGNYRYGPALSLDYYHSHGFHVRDNDWRRYNEHHGDWGHGHEWNGDHHFNGAAVHHDWNHGGETRFNGAAAHHDEYHTGFSGQTHNNWGGNDHHNYPNGGGNDHHTYSNGGTSGNFGHATNNAATNNAATNNAGHHADHDSGHDHGGDHHHGGN